MGKRDRERVERIKRKLEQPYLIQKEVDARLRKYGLYDDFTGIEENGLILLKRKCKL